MQMARKVGVKIIWRIVVINSFSTLPPAKVLVKIKPFNTKSPIFNLSFPTPPPHIVYIL